MTELPMITSAPPAKATGKPAASDSAKQDAQGFSNVLARQVADSDKPAESSAPATSSTEKQATTEEGAKKSPTAAASTDTAATIPADILAALLAQQNPTAPVQPGAILPAGIDTENAPKAELGIEVASAENPLLSANKGDKPAPTPIALLPGAMGKKDIAKEPVDLKTKPSKLLADNLKLSDTKQLNSAANSSALHKNMTNDLSATTPPSGFMPLLAGASSTNINQMQVTAPVTQPAWADEFSQKITWLSTQKNQSAELHLNPPQLGPLDVVLKVNGDQATAMFSSPHAAVREAIEQALPKLREMMAESGIMLGNAMVSDQTPKNEQHTASRQAQGKNSAVSDRTTDTESTQEVRVSSISRHNGMVDTFA